jgi:hypothetical protein
MSSQHPKFEVCGRVAHVPEETTTRSPRIYPIVRGGKRRQRHIGDCLVVSRERELPGTGTSCIRLGRAVYPDRIAACPKKSSGRESYCVTQMTKLNSASSKRPVIFQQPSVGMSIPTTMNG